MSNVAKTGEALQVKLSPIKRLQTLLKRAEDEHTDDVVDVSVAMQ